MIVAWPSLAAAQEPGRFSIDAFWTIASSPSNPYAGTLRFTVSGTAAKTPYGTLALSYATPVLTGSLTSAPNGCTAASASLQMLSNGVPRVAIIADLDATGANVHLRFTVRYNWNLQCPDGSGSQLAGYEAIGACQTSSPCATSAPVALPSIATDIYQCDSTGPSRADTTLMLHARVSLVPFTPVTSKLVNPNPALLDAHGQLAATEASAATLSLARERRGVQHDHVDQSGAIVVERTMWWPGVESRGLSGEFWSEAHNSPGATETGTAWALAEGEVGGSMSAETYILIANTSDTSGRVTVTLHFEDGTTATRTLDLMPRRRANVQVSADFPEAIGRKFGAVIRGLPNTSGLSPQLVVERAMYASVNGETWAGGTNAMGTRLQ